jgi:hypothetical protein
VPVSPYQFPPESHLSTTFDIARYLRGLRDASVLSVSEDWYINPSTGSDITGDGSASRPFKTHHQLETVIGLRERRIVDSGSTSGAPSILTINIANSLVAGDSINCDLGVGYNGVIKYVGTRTPLLPGSGLSTFTSVTAKNPATQTPSLITDTTVATFTPYIGKLIVITNSATPGHIGAQSWVAKAPGANQARTGTWLVPDPVYNYTNGTEITPSTGDTYAIYDIPACPVGEMNFFSATNNIPSGPGNLTTAYVDISNINFSGAFVSGCIGTKADLIIYTTGCTYDSILLGNLWMSNNPQLLNQCQLQGGIFTGGITRLGGSVVYQTMFQRTTFDMDHMAQGTYIAFVSGATIYIPKACAFDSTGFGIGLDQGGIIGTGTGVSLWGSGNATVGIRCSAGASVYYGTKPTITGAGDTQVGGVAKAYAAIPYADAVNFSSIVAYVS